MAEDCYDADADDDDQWGISHAHKHYSIMPTNSTTIDRYGDSFILQACEIASYCKLAIKCTTERGRRALWPVGC